MLTTIRDAQDRLVACCSWSLKNRFGLDDLTGYAVWIEQLEINPGGHGRVLIRQLIRQIAELAPMATMAYWQRRDSTGATLHAYRRTQLLKKEGMFHGWK